MNRRTFGATVGALSVGVLSGCIQNPFQSTDIPTETQNQYLTNYPSVDRVSTVSQVTPIYTDNGTLLRVVSFGGISEFIVYTIQPNGNGTELLTITPDSYSNSNTPPVIDNSTLQNGDIILIVGLYKSVEYTQTAFYYDHSSSSFVYPVSEE